MRHLIIAVHDGFDQLACVHLAESDEERNEVWNVANSYGPVWSFPLADDEPLQKWFEEPGDGYEYRVTYQNALNGLL